jgi:chromosomal replication initiation ATPase DnaA
MARPLRIEYKGAFYHITARGNERKRIFFSKIDYEKFKVADHFKVSPQEVLKDKRGRRNIAIYLIKKWTSVTNGQIADTFGGVSCSAIAKANERFSVKIMKDRTLRRTVDKISRKISYAKG